MTKIKYINTDVFQYVPIEDAFNECTRITNLKTGITESLSAADKLFYVKMRHRHQFFVIERGGIYYDDIEQLGASIGISSSTATRTIARLKKVGLVVATLSGRSNKWTILPLTPDNFLLERDINAMNRGAAPEWVDCLKYPVFGNAKEEKQQPIPETDPMCEFDELSEDETPAPEKVKPAPKPAKKPAARKAPAKQQTVSPFEFKKPRDETQDWRQLKRLNDESDRFLVFHDYDLPYLVLFESQGKLTNPAAIEHLKIKRNIFERTGRL